MKHSARLRRLEAAHRRHRGADDRIPVFVVNRAGKRIAGPHYTDGNGDYRLGLWQVTDDKQITNQ